MRKTLLFCLFVISAASQAQISAIGPFATPVFCQENFDSIAPGSYATQPLFSGPMFGLAYAINTPNMLDIMPPPFWQPPALSAPNTLTGNGTDVGIRVSPVMRRFGAWFRNSPNTAGVAATAAKVAFYDANGVLLGTAGIPLTNTWTWFGWMTNPPNRYAFVEIYTGMPGGVELDDVSVRFN